MYFLKRLVVYEFEIRFKSSLAVIQEQIEARTRRWSSALDRPESLPDGKVTFESTFMDFERPFQFRRLVQIRHNIPTAFCVPIGDGKVRVRIKISLVPVTIVSLFSLPIGLGAVIAVLNHTGVYQGGMTFGDSGPLGFAIMAGLMLLLSWGFILFTFASERKVLVRFLKEVLGT